MSKKSSLFSFGKKPSTGKVAPMPMPMQPAVGRVISQQGATTDAPMPKNGVGKKVWPMYSKKGGKNKRRSLKRKQSRKQKQQKGGKKSRRNRNTKNTRKQRGGRRSRRNRRTRRR